MKMSSFRLYRLFKDNIKHLKYKVWNRLNRSKVIHQVFQRFRSNLAYSYIKNPTPLNDILVASLIRLNNIQCQFLCSFTTWKVNRCIILVDIIMKDLFFSRRCGNFFFLTQQTCILQVAKVTNKKKFICAKRMALILLRPI